MSCVTVKKTGEWDEAETSKKALEVVGDVVAEYLKHGEGRKFICSAVDTKHVDALAKQFREAGINVATYTFKDREEDRADTTREFRKPNSELRGLITVTAASRGFDVPDVSCVIMARPLRKSLAEHIQLLGRGLRIAEGKTDCIVLDHSGNCARFFQDCEAFFDEGIHELDTGKKAARKAPKKKMADAVKCPQCRALHFPAAECPHCGHAYPRRQAVKHVPGTLKEMIAGGHKKELTNTLWPMVCGYALKRRGEREIARKMALAIYKDITGAWPTQDFSRTQPAEPSREVMNRIQAAQIRHKHRRKAA
ncbi:DEAD/DEAH box helicase [Luteibacter sp. NPDC031894]|uniref:DEAD/DEAH box helicase n=1 Tax=Luteibacter sp. NPDC031894 TaxID=3390572 RepID=UPI003D039B7A